MQTMTPIELGDSGLLSAPLGFGCSALLGRSGRSDSLRALAAAWDHGIRFFDTARSYGYGESEALLGNFLHGRREQAVIATKFGILPAPPSIWKNIAKAAARKVLAVAPSARALVRKGAASQFSGNQFTTAVLHQSLETSLRKLRTDYVDFLFLHAAPASVLEQEDLLEAMGRLVEAGKIRVAGLSADPDVILLASSRRVPPLRAMQFPCNVFDLSLAGSFSAQQNGRPVLIANHPFGGTARVEQCQRILRDLAARPELDRELRDKLNHRDDTLLADIVFNLILRDTGIHVVIPAMMRVEHIRANVQAVAQSRFSAPEIAVIRAALFEITGK